jgi:DNA polymerase III subunit epsilon
MLQSPWSLESRRTRSLRAAPPGALRDYLSVPFPPGRSDCRSARFTALDLETTGLDPDSDEIVSVGWVCLTGTRIDLSTAGHLLVQPTREMPETSAILHRITDDMARHGLPLRTALARVLGVLAGSVLVAHNAAFELQFLTAACASVFGGRFLIPAVDTLELAGRAMRWRDAGWESGAGAALRVSRGGASLRLDALRRSYNLPRYPAHDALSDALAVAELFLAQLARSGTKGVPLRKVLVPG